ncbi:MAG: hypothetical protein EB141_21485, partial [Verrucomicrobia bacterium]|nr:hypothetical protein [Verrucomicrobiota bacterium]
RMIDLNGDYLDELGGEWSPRLVPVSEVEKAWREGVKVTDAEKIEPQWLRSRARKVVEGENL